jgi:transposase
VRDLVATRWIPAADLQRFLASLGHDARLMPAKYVRPYSKGQKNDFNDAEGLASMYQASDWSFCSGPSWISARVRSH